MNSRGADLRATRTGGWPRLRAAAADAAIQPALRCGSAPRRWRNALLASTALAVALPVVAALPLAALFTALSATATMADGGGGSIGTQYGGAGGVDSPTGPGGAGGAAPLGDNGGGGGGGAGATGGVGGSGDADGYLPGVPGVGGVGGSSAGSAGAAGLDGSGGSRGAGGGGGGGGAHGFVDAALPEAAASGGAGGSGGNGVGTYGDGGGGGAGGYGAVVTGTGSLGTLGSAVTGGAGGNGGSGFFGGNGGTGGIGLFFAHAAGATFTVDAAVQGGAGSAGGAGWSPVDNSGTGGAGGAGIVGQNLTITVGAAGTVAGGAGANAITFTGGTNRLDLHAGSTITGNVVAFSAADTLALGGAGNASFDVSQIGPAAQYRGFGLFEKTGSSTWTLTGTTAAALAWTINAGTLAVGTDANLGAASGGLTFNGGALQFLSGFTTNRAVTLDTGGGSFDTAGNTATLGGNIGGAGGLTKTGAGTLTLSGANTYTGGTTISVGTLQLGDGGTSGSILGVVAVGYSGTFNVVNADTSGITSISNGGTTNFLNNTSAGSAAIANNGVLSFHDASTAGNATIANNDTLLFHETSTAGSATIIGGFTSFRDSSTAGTATINISAFTGVEFRDSSTAGAAAINNSFGTEFQGSSTAGSATITTSSGGVTSFRDGSTGGLARFITNIGGAVDISALGSAGMTAGSIEGAGSYFLGTKTLTVGGNDLSTAVGGVIQDGGIFGGTGGSLVKEGAGTLTLSGANTYSGGTTLAGGTLRLANNQALGSGTLTTTGSVVDYAAGVTIGNSIVVDSNTTQLQVTAGSATQAGVISEFNGPRPLEKTGAGTLVLTATNTYSGPTTVSAGALVVDGAIANSAVTVNAGALLTGSGTVGATTINSGGMFAPGSGTPGSSMTVAGNLAFQSGAFYLVQVDPSNASRANVTAGGTAALAGTAVATFAPGSYVTRNYTILHADGGLGGTFDALATDNLPAGFTARLDYTGSDVILNLTGALGTAGLAGNQRNVAGALNDFFNNGGALPPSFVSVFGLTGGSLGNALSQLSGEAATGGRQAGFQMTSQFLALMLDPLVDGRGGVAGAGGPALGFAPERNLMPDGPLSSGADVALAYSSVLKAPKAPPAPSFEQRWTAWGGAFGGYNKTNGDPAVTGSHDLTARTAGVAAGLDYRVAPGTVVGFALAGGGTDWSLAQGLGGGRSDAFQAGVYGTLRSGPAYLAAAFAYAHHWMSTDRVAFAGDHLTAEFNAQSVGGRVESGYRYATMLGGLTPYAALQAQSFRTPGYAERDLNNGGFALAYNARTGTATRSELGARFDHAVALDPTALLTLRARAAWAHDWVSASTLAAAFQALPGASFIVNGATPAKDSALASAGAGLKLANGVTLLGKLDGEFAARAATYSGTATVRYAW